MSRLRAIAMRITVHCAMVELCSSRCSAVVVSPTCKPTKISDATMATEATICETKNACSSDMGCYLFLCNRLAPGNQFEDRGPLIPAASPSLHCQQGAALRLFLSGRLGRRGRPGPARYGVTV